MRPVEQEHSMHKISVLIVAVFALGGCQMAESSPAISATPVTLDDAVQAPPFVEGICGECHGVTAFAVSPHPEAPGFANIASRPGITRETLTTFLADAHNYPAQMDVDLDEGDISVVARYMLTLRSDSDIRPPN